MKLLFIAILFTSSLVFAKDGELFKSKEECKAKLLKKISFPDHEDLQKNILAKYIEKTLEHACDVSMIQQKTMIGKSGKCGPKEDTVKCFRRLAYDYLNRNGISALGTIMLAASSSQVVFNNKDQKIQNIKDRDKKAFILIDSTLDLIDVSYIDIFLFLKKRISVHQMLAELDLKLDKSKKAEYEKLISDIQNATEESKPTDEQKAMLKTPAFSVYYLELHEQDKIKEFKKVASKKILELYKKAAEKIIAVDPKALSQDNLNAFKALTQRIAKTSSILQNIFKVEPLPKELDKMFRTTKEQLKEHFIKLEYAAEAQQIQS